MDFFCDDPGCPGNGDKGEDDSLLTVVVLTAVTTAVGIMVNWGMDWLKNHVEIRLKRPEEVVENHPDHYLIGSPSGETTVLQEERAPSDEEDKEATDAAR